jgi:hypothetical protein
MRLATKFSVQEKQHLVAGAGQACWSRMGYLLQVGILVGSYPKIVSRLSRDEIVRLTDALQLHPVSMAGTE